VDDELARLQSRKLVVTMANDDRIRDAGKRHHERGKSHQRTKRHEAPPEVPRDSALRIQFVVGREERHTLIPRRSLVN
jgi:hypothetical protein